MGWEPGVLEMAQWEHGLLGTLAVAQWEHGGLRTLAMAQWEPGVLEMEHGVLQLWQWHMGNLGFRKWNLGRRCLGYMGIWQWNRMKTCEFCLKNLIFPCTSRNFVSIATFSYLLFM